MGKGKVMVWRQRYAGIVSAARNLIAWKES